jgi:hypothetical protein
MTERILVIDDGEDDRRTAGLGLATMRCVVGRSGLDAVTAADAQLHATKAAGRNRISATSLSGGA